MIKEGLEEVAEKGVKAEDVVKGLETTLEELVPALLEQIPDLSTKQLRRALTSVINFVGKAQDDTEIGAMRDAERRFLGGMVLLVESSRQYYVHILKQLQQEAKEQENGKE